MALIVLVSACGSAIAGDLQIDRNRFFERCSSVVKSKASFEAMDRGQLTTFRLRSNILKGEPRDNIEHIFDYIEKVGYPTDLRQVAYLLGTAHRETGATMLSVRETVFCRDDACVQRFITADYAKPAKNGKAYYGRGFVQLTHATNYEKLGRGLALKPPTLLYDDPDLALQLQYAIPILVDGMYRGLFAHKSLSNFFNATTEDWDGARQIVNPGSKRATITAGFAKLYLRCLRD